MSVVGLLLLGACSRPPDVILVTVDTLRADHVGVGPSGSTLTPSLDLFAQQAITFTDAWSPISVTGPAFCSMLTGQEPGRHGVMMNIGPAGLPPLGPAAFTLAERLSTKGYTSAAFVSGFTLRPELGLDQGYSLYSAPRTARRPGEQTAARATAWIGQAEGPIHLWFHTYDAHGPWTDYPEVAEQAAWRSLPAAPIPDYQRIGGITDPDFYAQRYRRAVLAADAQVGALLGALHAADRFDPALIIVTSDHGESLTEQPLWFDHGTAPSAEQLHVPLFVKLPFQERAGERVSAPVSLLDLLPTVLSVAGLAPDPTLDGHSLLGPLSPDRILLGEDSHCKEHPALPCAPRGPRGKAFAARDGSFSLLRAPAAAGPVYTLFDRKADPAEQKPLDTPPPAALIAAVDAAAAARAAVDWPVETPTSGD